jgi:hypothetical protein
MTDYADLEKRLRDRADNWERVSKFSSWTEEIVQSEIDAKQLREAADALAALTRKLEEAEAKAKFPADDGQPHYGKDCPKGSVQVEFVTVDPALRHNAYGWVPTDRRKILVDIYVDGVRFCINVGDIGEHCSDGVARRGIHIIGPMANIGNASLNAISYATEESESLPKNIHEEFREKLRASKEHRLSREDDKGDAS